MEWNYYDTFITVAADCPVERGTVPLERRGGKTKPAIEYELLANHPYTYTQEELLYETYVRHKQIPEQDLLARGTQIRVEFYRKPQPCLRASMLPKKYGWGLHFNAEGKIALIPMESPDYESFVCGGAPNILAAMRNSRQK